MLNLADYIAILILIALAFWGSKKGLVRSIFSLGSLVLSLVLAYLFTFRLGKQEQVKTPKENKNEEK